MGTRAPSAEVDEPSVCGGVTHGDVWLRRCTTCRHDDLDAAFGQPALIPEHRWRCPACAGIGWEAARVPFPARPTGPCPYRDRR